MTTINKTLTIRSTSCGECGILFGLEAAFMDNRQDDGQSFYCPNGHKISWKAANQAAKVEQALNNSRAREQRLKDQATAAIVQAELVRVDYLRDRERFSNGVCPCCNRSFVQVARHIQSQHPGYDVTRVRQGADRFECSCGSLFETLRGLRVHQGRMRGDAWARPDTEPWMSHLTVYGS